MHPVFAVHRYFINFKPVDTVGYSTYIYRIMLEDANRMMP
jgi:hypothetical protein